MYFNISSIRNNFSDWQELMKGKVDVVMIAETKIYTQYPTVEFLLENYHQTFRLEINSKSGATVVYVKSSILHGN